MNDLEINGKSYRVDSEGFLLDYGQWDKNFVEAMAAKAGVVGRLSDKHWEIIHFIRATYDEYGKCPLVYQTCKHTDLRLKELQNLFPAGYLRGACRLAGITYRESYLNYAWAEHAADDLSRFVPEKTYEIDARGFLLRAYDWDRQFAALKATELKIPGGLSPRHWEIIDFLRNYHLANREVPTVFETCEKNNLSVDELERLFPDGYHRGAVKIAGLKVR